MAHELATNAATGEASMFYVRSEGAPWHHLGIPVEGALTASEAIDRAGMGYEVASCPMYAKAPDGSVILTPSHVLNVRRDNNTPLGVVSSNYKIIQNHECFEFLDKVASEGEIAYHTAGVLGVGERIWMLAKLPDLIQIGRTDDVIEKYLLLYNSHDSSSALRCLWTPTRVVCWNTCSAALQAGEGTGITIRHTGEVGTKIREAQRVLGLASKFFQAYGEGANFLAGYQPTTEQLDDYFKALYPDPEKADPANAKAKRMALWGLFEKGMGNDMPGVAGTAWAAYNAVTEFVDHHTGTDERRRMESSWYGDGAKLKIRAFDQAVKMANAN